MSENKKKYHRLEYITFFSNETILLFNKHKLKYVEEIFIVEDSTILPMGEHKYNFKNSGKHNVLISWKDEIDDVSNFFLYCQNLSSIPSDLFKELTSVTKAEGTFFGCHNLTKIPEDLFKDNKLIKSFYCVFYDSGINQIPKVLFKNNVDARCFAYAFCSCNCLESIPKELFKYNMLADNFSYCFAKCYSLKTIPNKLFAYNRKCSNFYDVFKDCYELKFVPFNIFPLSRFNSLKVGECFSKCKKLCGSVPIDEKGFEVDRNYVNHSDNCFSGCYNLNRF